MTKLVLSSLHPKVKEEIIEYIVRNGHQPFDVLRAEINAQWNIGLTKELIMELYYIRHPTTRG